MIVDTPTQAKWDTDKTPQCNYESTESTRSSTNYFDAEENMGLSATLEQVKEMEKEPTPPVLDEIYQSSEESLSPALREEIAANRIGEDDEDVIAENGSAAEEESDEDDDDDEDFGIIEVVEAKPFKIERAVAINVAASGKANVVKVADRWSGSNRGRYSQRYGSQSSSSPPTSESRSSQSQTRSAEAHSPTARIGPDAMTPRPRLDTSISLSSDSSATQTAHSEGRQSENASVSSSPSDKSVRMQSTTAGPVDPFDIGLTRPSRVSTLPLERASETHSSTDDRTDFYDNRHSQAPTISSYYHGNLSQSRSDFSSQEESPKSRHSRSATVSSRFNDTISQWRSSSLSRPATPQSTSTRANTEISLSRGPSSATSISGGTSLSRGPSSATTYSTSLSRGPSTSTSYSTGSFVFPDSAATNHSFLEMDPYHLPQAQPLQKSNTRSKLRHVSSKLVASLNGPKSPASEGMIPVDEQTTDLQRRRSVAAASAPEISTQNTPFFFSQRTRDEWYRRHEEKIAIGTHDEKIVVPVIPRSMAPPPPMSAGSISSTSTSSTARSSRFARMLARPANERAPAVDLPPCPTGYDPFVPELTTTTSIVAGGSVKKTKSTGSSKPKSGGLSWSRN